MPRNHVASPCRAVVVKIIVAVNAMFGPVVFVDSLCNHLFFFGCEVKMLFPNAASSSCILRTESIEGLYAHLIIGESEDKPQHKKRLLKRKHTIVNGQIDASCLVFISDGRVSVQAVHVFVGFAGEQTDLHRVHFSVQNLFRLGRGLPTGNQEHHKKIA